ncbi:GntR family transcriptional regulator [Microvirga puerhi]|uniref:GntR family transcriptional regulator n=1 Tax=Microvirga puerhi TaxID=2876078 RepID=A0ABS7VVI1_9HYPH|nr:GntR family transcriptional regulator [Microvirga puerhi]MBZ6078982.1 GntR family transcriptional regulator [Microvirga puerhi]
MSVLEPINKDGPPESSDGAKVAHVKDRIREMILKGELDPGHPIRERTLANRLGVSRTPMREALKLLAGENLVELHPHRGAIVAILRRSEVFEIIQVLAALEGLAAELACTAITDKEMAELWALHYEMLAFRARKERLRYFQNNQAIHLGIVHAARNAVLAEHHAILNARVYRLRFIAHQATENWDNAVREHEEFLHVLEARDAARARPLLTAHVASIWTRLSTILDEDGTITEQVPVT